jgi:hypothetical protein
LEPFPTGISKTHCHTSLTPQRASLTDFSGTAFPVPLYSLVLLMTLISKWQHMAYLFHGYFLPSPSEYKSHKIQAWSVLFTDRSPAPKMSPIRGKNFANMCWTDEWINSRDEHPVIKFLMLWTWSLTLAQIFLWITLQITCPLSLWVEQPQHRIFNSVIDALKLSLIQHLHAKCSLLCLVR